MEQAHMFDEKELWDHCLATVFSNSIDVLTCEDKDYENLCYDCFKTIVKDDQVNAREEQIFLACKIWAEKKCVEKEMEASDENLRLLLVDILGLIRFPLMKESDFTELVSSSDLLTAEEKLGVYKTFNSIPTDGNTTCEQKSRFSSQARVREWTHRVQRFKQIMGGMIDYWENDNLYDAVSFKCSSSINLTGVLLFSPFPEGTIKGDLSIYDPSNAIVVRINCVELSHEDNKIVDIKLRKVLKIEENKWYTVRQQMSGSWSYFGVKGQKEIAGKGIVFTFRNSPMDTNNTNVENGQICGLLYN